MENETVSLILCIGLILLIILIIRNYIIIKTLKINISIELLGFITGLSIALIIYIIYY